MLKDCNLVEAGGQDVPSLHKFRTIALNKLGQYDKAMKKRGKMGTNTRARRRALLPEGPITIATHRPGEAAAAYEKSLDEDPDAAGSLAGLAEVLPADRKADLLPRFMRVSRHRAMFFIMRPPGPFAIPRYGWHGRSDRCLPPLAWLGGRPAADLLPNRGQVYPQAIQRGGTRLQDAVAAGEQKGLRGVRDGILIRGVSRGRRDGSLSGATDPLAVFRQLAAKMASPAQSQMLRRLVTTHLQRFPTDPWAHYYRGKLHQEAGNGDEADAEYAVAMSSPNETDVKTFRTRGCTRTSRRAKACRRIRTSVREMRSFHSLPGCFPAQSNPANWQAWLQPGADNPRDPNLPLWDADARFLAGQYASALDLLDTYRDAIERDKGKPIHVVRPLHSISGASKAL